MKQEVKCVTYYINQYDLFTIEQCLDTIKTFQNIYIKDFKTSGLENVSEEDKLKSFNIALNRYLFFIITQRFKDKAQIIQQWIDRDNLRQKKLDSTSPPSDVMCLKCSTLMVADDFKHLDYSIDDKKPIRVLFFFNCQNCKNREGVYDNGEIRRSNVDNCPECKSEIIIKVKDEDGKLITTRRCSSCKYKDIDIYDSKKAEIERKSKEDHDNKLLEKYRNEFCLSDKQGQQNIEIIEAIEVASVIYDEEIQKYNDPVYEKAKQLIKITIASLQETLSEKLNESGYIEFSLSKPESGKFIVVPFSALDSKASRKNMDSISNLEKLLKETLENTNWKLLSGSISSRLGYLEGRLQGYESEEDLIKLAGKQKNNEIKQSKIDNEKRQKYTSNNIVQLARLSGEMQGIENMRKRRLEKEPDGFKLDANASYSCAICGETHYGDEVWWNLDGIRCIDCRRNILEGIIPSIKSRYDNKDQWFAGWQIKSDYDVHSATAGKLRRQGILIGRDLKRQDGSVYFTVYLVSENKAFLNKNLKNKPVIKV